MADDYPVKIVSFSGIDGAGKTTQIQAFEVWLAEAGIPSKTLTFWDDIVVLVRFREVLAKRAFGGDQGIGSPEKPLNRRDKNVTWWPVMAVRLVLYLADAIRLQLRVRALKSGGGGVFIFDRYIYDELANLPLHAWVVRSFVRLILRMVPRPDVAYLIDAEPLAARLRKPEYPLEFLRRNRESYLTLSNIVGGMEIIEPLSPEAASAQVREAFIKNTGSSESGAALAQALPWMGRASCDLAPRGMQPRE